LSHVNATLNEFGVCWSASTKWLMILLLKGKELDFDSCILNIVPTFSFDNALYVRGFCDGGHDTVRKLVWDSFWSLSTKYQCQTLYGQDGPLSMESAMATVPRVQNLKHSHA